MKLHHIGYAVADIEKATSEFVSLGYVIESKTVDVARNIVIVFAKNNGTLIELISPLNKGSPVDNILEKNGPMPYHICYEVANIFEATKNLKQVGYLVIQKTSPAPALNEQNVCFMYSKTLGIIELVESPLS